MAAPDDTAAALRRQLAEARVDRDQLAELRAQLEDSEREVARIPSLEDDVQHLRRRLEIAEAEHASRVRDAGEVHAAHLAEVRERLARADAALRALQASPSWRVTRPLRAVKRLAR